MDKVLVTGATGFVGSALVRELLKRGHAVRVTVRENSDQRNLKGLAVEEVIADVIDREAMRRAMAGCSTLYHVAAIYRTWMRDYGELKRVNVGGTRTVLEAALEAKLEKVVYTSSIGALGKRDDGKPSTEDTPFNLFHLKIPYEISKHESELVAKEFYQRGLPLVIVRPALVIGPGDVYPTPSGKMVLDVVQKKIPAYFDGAIDVVDVDDVAVGQILAMERGTCGESYNLGNKDNFVTIQSLFSLIAEVGGVNPPLLCVPISLVMAWAYLITAIADYVTRRPPLVTPGSIQALTLKRRVDFSRAIRTLGIPQTPLRTTIEKTVNWYRRERVSHVAGST